MLTTSCGILPHPLKNVLVFEEICARWLPWLVGLWVIYISFSFFFFPIIFFPKVHLLPFYSLKKLLSKEKLYIPFHIISDLIEFLRVNLRSNIHSEKYTIPECVVQ